ncbi:E3 ubiquitin/ISG15 ligase TRIM25-like [Denticeps clupeoides]|uniref:Tripartite motif-containing protein 16-like n=1 Tax=Denticeps clupeoides TaxID=299321 RepID=A0AAY4E3D0_9TELE|nr:E3 ubiquitin/ISG15 ligase TRIM25-like [Denticeps clupeoides]
MTEAEVKRDDSFCCSICLDILKDPVTIPCGHSYCKDCISGYWDQENGTGEYRCPQCIVIFSSRPVLNKNTALAEMMKKVMKTAVDVHRHGGVEEVLCDVCTGMKHKAVKSCLVCLASLCETHIQPHYESPPYKKHKLVKASTNLQEKICPQHDKLVEVFCRTDQKCICILCTMDEHKSHETVSIVSEIPEKQKQLADMQMKLKKRIQERGKKKQKMEKALKDHRFSAQVAVADTDRICQEIMQSTEKRCSEIKNRIRDQERASVSESEKVLGQFQEEIKVLKRRDAELECLSHIEDHITFLQNIPPLLSLPSSKELDSITISPCLSFETLNKPFDELKDNMEDFLTNYTEEIFEEVREIQIVLPPEPQTRDEFLNYLVGLELDANTVYGHIALSEENTKATFTHSNVSYPPHPERFDNCHQVLCCQGLTRRSYWEVQCDYLHLGRAETVVGIAVSYKGINRKTYENSSLFGSNYQSWKLIWNYNCNSQNAKISYSHNNKTVQVAEACDSSKVGVYLDHKAGTLSFYKVSDQMTLLYRVQTTFSEPLYPGFYLEQGSSVKICSD